ncbi:MAG TPA: porin family protein [Flavisolibacter sp.]|nr:porin family protein [Flavisolibacter sp.]
MKRQIVLFASLLVSVISMAQTKPMFGLRGGVSTASMKGDAVNSLNSLLDFSNGAITTNPHTGFFGGGYASIPLGGPVSLEPALYYTQKGYEMNGDIAIKGADFLGANARAKLTTGYIDLPVLLKVNMNGFQVFAGPQISYLSKADLKTTAGLLGFNLLNKTMDATNQFNRWDAGVTGGIGYQFANGLNLSAAYDHGLARTDANKSLNAYNRSFKIGLGYNF